MDYSNEAMTALAEYVMEPIRERLKQHFPAPEFDAIIINLGEIREVLRKAGML